MAFKTGKDGIDEEEKKDKPDGTGSDTGATFSKSALDFRNDRWKLTPTPANGNRLGEKLTYKVKVGTGSDASYQTVNMYVPGIAKVDFLPTFGVSSDSGSPISTLASTVYSEILSALKRASLGFDPTAVVVHMLALDSMYCAYDMAVRAYKALNTTDVDNAYLAKNLVEACGFDYNDLTANKANLYFWFSTAKATLKEFVAPKNFAMIGAHRAMCSNAYHDSPSSKSQLYVFTPKFLWSWERVDTAGGLGPVNMAEGTGSDPMKFATFVRIFDTMKQALLNSTDFKNINGSIRATYADSDVYTFEMPGPDDTLPLVIDEIVLNSLLNATPLGEMTMSTAMTFAPTDAQPNVFEIHPAIPHTSVNLAQIVNSINDCPTSEEMVSNMRWHVAFDEATQASDNNIKIVSCGTEVILSMSAHSLNDNCPFLETVGAGNPGTKITSFKFGGGNTRQLVDQTLAMNEAEVTNDFNLLLENCFRWRPITMVTRTVSYGAGTLTVYSTLVTDWNYQATVSNADLIAWHTALIFSACSL